MPPGTLNFVPFDLSRVDGIPELVRELKAEHGPLYGLVNNAALGTDGLLSNMHNSDIEKLVRLNTLSPIILTKYAVRAMMTAGEGRIVNIAPSSASPATAAFRSMARPRPRCWASPAPWRGKWAGWASRSMPWRRASWKPR